MDAEFAKCWVADLRDPSNTQCTSQLHDGVGYCCLGRAAVLAGAVLVPLREERWDEDGEGPKIITKKSQYVIDGTQIPSEIGLTDMVGGQRAELTDTLAAKIGMNWPNGSLCDDFIVINDDDYTSLADANDGGCTFAEIADWIEANYERL